MKLNRKILIQIAALLVFLLSANQLYRAFFHEEDLQEYSDLINLIREIPDSTQVVYFGESSNFTFGNYDLNTSRISDLISGFYPDIEFGTVSHGALHAGNYKVLIKQISKDSNVETLIVTLNLRSFNPQWIESKLETGLAKSMVLLRKTPPLFNRSILSFKAYDIKTDDKRQKIISKHWEKDEVFLMSRGKETTIDEWTGEILSRPDSVMKQPDRQLGMHYIRTYAFDIDTTENIRIKDFDKIVNIARKRNWNLVLNLMAENTEKANKLIGPDLVKIMRENALLLENRYSKMGVTVVNNLESVSDPNYLDQNWTTEHYDEAGRKIVAANVAGRIRDFYPDEYIEVQYYDNVPKSEFFNDCEGEVRWFQMGSCSREQSYSGEYSSKINREDQYSIGFTRPINMIPAQKLNKARVTFQYFQPYDNADAKLIMEIQGGSKEKVWVHYQINNSKPDINVWQKIEHSFTLTSEVHEYGLIKLYVWNPGKEHVFIDDLEIQFH